MYSTPFHQQEMSSVSSQSPNTPATPASAKEQQTSIDKPTSRGGRPPTACLNCRMSRQRCDRKMPCSRCTCQGQVCRYPTYSNRGRKKGSTNKPDTVEKILAQLRESSVGDQVMRAILESNAEGCKISPSLSSKSIYKDNNAVIGEADLHPSLISPINALATTVTSNRVVHWENEPQNDRYHQLFNLESWRPLSNPTEEKIVQYFSPKSASRTDWQVLASQTSDATLRLESTACDPLTANLIDQTDVEIYFNLFFEIRNPFVCLMDPALHTPEYVYSMSFTLFSAICALGCAVSERPRDQILHPVLYSMAEATMKWAIASSIKTVEIVQAILNMQYWAPMTQRQSDDPSWLRLSHAVQLAKEIGLDKPTTIAEQVSFLCPNGTAKQKACLTQNFERTWYHCFISDKSFGIISGKSSLVSWSQIPKSVSDWWQKAMASPHDRVVSGVVEMRQLLVKLLQQGKRKDKAPSCILKWYSQALIDMEQVLSLRCAPDEKPSSLYLPILAFYIDHSALILGAQALRELATLESADTTDEVITISRKNANVASRLLDHVIYDRVFQDCKVGYHNNQFLMMCHASTEILNAINRGALDPGEIEQAAERSFTVAKRMEEISRYIPATSAVHLYFDISHFLSREIRKASDIGKSTLEKTDSTSSCATGEWLKLIDENTIDLSNWLDEGLFGSDPMLDAETRNFIEDGTIADV